MRSFEDGDDADNNSEIGWSDILESPCPTGEGGEGSHVPNYDFHVVDLKDPVLDLQMKFSNIQMFRDVVKEFNVRRGKDIIFFFLKQKKKKKKKKVYSGVQRSQVSLSIVCPIDDRWKVLSNKIFSAKTCVWQEI
jgi:hypothetical protein